MSLPSFPGASEFAGEFKMRKIASLRSRLEDSTGAAEDVGQREALRDVLGAGLLTVHVLAGLSPPMLLPSRASWDRSRSERRRYPAERADPAGRDTYRSLCFRMLLVDDVLHRLPTICFHITDRDELHVRFG